MADQNELLAKTQSFAKQAKERALSCKNEQETKNYLIAPRLMYARRSNPRFPG